MIEKLFYIFVTTTTIMAIYWVMAAPVLNMK